MNLPTRLLLPCIVGLLTISPIAALAESGATTLPWSDWSVRDAEEGEFTLSDATGVFQRDAGTSDPYLSRPIDYGKRHFTFKIRYRTDGRLSPTVLIFLPASVDVRPLAIIRLPATEEWKDFETDFVGHDAKQSAVEMRLYPGTIGPDLLKEGGLKARGHHPGKVEFASLSWAPTDEPVRNLTKGPQAFSTTKVAFKRIGDLELKVHIDRPERPVSQVAAIWFHGGGFIGGTPDSSLSQTTYLASRGIICVRPQYRLVNQGGNVDTTLQDAVDAVEWVKKHGADYGIDPRRFIIAGTSAGAVLGSILAQRTEGCLGFVGLAGFYDAVNPGDSAAIDRRAAFFKFGAEPAIWTRISAIHQIHRRPPPVFLIHGLLDSTIDCRQSVAYAHALRLAGGRVELVVLPWLNHAPNLVADDVFGRVKGFIRELQRATEHP